jgi:hypothetical protein
MKYVIFGMAALLAGQCALAQTAAPATPPSEPAKKDTVTQPAPVKGAAAAKYVGTKDRTVEADAYLKAQERKKSARARKMAARGGDSKAAADGAVRPGSLMSEEERVARREKLQSFKTLAECDAYENQHQVEMEARAKAQHKTLSATGYACNRYKVAEERARAATSAGKATAK